MSTTFEMMPVNVSYTTSCLMAIEVVGFRVFKRYPRFQMKCQKSNIENRTKVEIKMEKNGTCAFDWECVIRFCTGAFFRILAGQHHTFTQIKIHKHIHTHTHAHARTHAREKQAVAFVRNCLPSKLFRQAPRRVFVYDE